MTTSKCLFRVYNIHTRKHTPGDYAEKADAKAHRDELNGGLSNDPDRTWVKDKGWRVSLGPDHWRYES